MDVSGMLPRRKKACGIVAHNGARRGRHSETWRRGRACGAMRKKALT